MVEAVSAADFLAWAAGVGVGFDPRYPDSGCLAVLPPRGWSDSWDVPEQPYPIPHFVETALDGLDPWEVGYEWPRAGRWPAWEADPGLPNERVRDAVWRVLGLPSGWAGAARVSRGERAVVVAVLFASLGLGGDATSDLFFVPGHGRQVVWAGHHDVLSVECADEARLQELVRHMSRAGYEEPRGQE